MNTYIVLITLTEQGIRNIAQSTHRSEAFRQAAEEAGTTVRQLYWTLGNYDGMLVVEAPDDDTVTALLVGLCAQGNVRTQSLRAFERVEFEAVLESATI